MITTRRIATVAIATGAVAIAVALALMPAVEPTPQGATGEDAVGIEWMLGLFLLAGPLLAATVVRSVAPSALLRPVGWVAGVFCALVSALHVAIAVDERGTGGWLYGSPAVGTAVLLVAAVLRGRDEDRMAEPDSASSSRTVAARAAGSELRGRTPLDVMSPLLAAREHAAKALIAWVVAVSVAGVVSIPVLRLTGWPSVDRRLEGTVVAVRPTAAEGAADGDAEVVTFEAETEMGVVRWTYELDDSRWEVGDRNVVYVDDDGGVHEDQQFGLTGIPLLGPVGFTAFFGGLAARRLWGLLVAWWDVRNGGDEPMLAFAAVIADPARRRWRPFVATWREDPTGSDRLAKPDAVYRADDETCEELQSDASAAVVRRAWVDTGIWARAKPRWIGFEHGVAIPHRRALFGRWYVHVITRKGEVGDVVALEHGPPGPATVHGSHPIGRRRARHALLPMTLWRLPVVVAGLVVGRLAWADEASTNLRMIAESIGG